MRAIVIVLEIFGMNFTNLNFLLGEILLIKNMNLNFYVSYNSFQKSPKCHEKYIKFYILSDFPQVLKILERIIRHVKIWIFLLV